jgi:amino acid transporter
MVIEIPIAFVYVWLSTALPRSGGDYVFQSRVFGGGVAFTVVMSGYVIWILQWVALSGWLLSYLGLAPLFLGLGATMGSTALSNLGIWFTSSTGIIITSILNALVAMMILISGFKNYVRLQVWMMAGTLIAFVTMLVVLFVANPASSMAKIDLLLSRQAAQNFVQTAMRHASCRRI